MHFFHISITFTLVTRIITTHRRLNSAFATHVACHARTRYSSELCTIVALHHLSCVSRKRTANLQLRSLLVCREAAKSYNHHIDVIIQSFDAMLLILFHIFIPYTGREMKVGQFCSLFSSLSLSIYIYICIYKYIQILVTRSVKIS